MSLADNHQAIPTKGSAIALDLFAVGTWAGWVVAYISEHPGEAVMWVLGLLLMLLRIPTAWLDLRKAWLDRKGRRHE